MCAVERIQIMAILLLPCSTWDGHPTTRHPPQGKWQPWDYDQLCFSHTWLMHVSFTKIYPVDKHYPLLWVTHKYLLLWGSFIHCIFPTVLYTNGLLCTFRLYSTLQTTLRPTYDLGLFVSEGGVEEDLFDPQSVPRRHYDPCGRHGGLSILLLQAVCYHHEGTQADVHPLRTYTSRGTVRVW